jgi:hypothetical protein
MDKRTITPTEKAQAWAKVRRERAVLTFCDYSLLPGGVLLSRESGINYAPTEARTVSGTTYFGGCDCPDSARCEKLSAETGVFVAASTTISAAYTWAAACGSGAVSTGHGARPSNRQNDEGLAWRTPRKPRHPHK